MENDSSNAKQQAPQHPGYKLATFISLVLPLAGLCLGFFFMAQEDRVQKELGAHTLRFSLFGVIGWFIAWQVLPPLMR